MRSEKWAEKNDWKKVLKTDAAGPILCYEDGKAYTFDGEGHAMILGVSGSGKSRRETVPMTMSFIGNKESAVIADAKGEIYANTKNMIPSVYDVHVIDFRNLYEEDSEGWNPLYAPYVLWKTGIPKLRHAAEQMVEELSHAMYPVSKNADPFWPKEARNVFLAAVYALFETGNEDEINLASVYYFIAQGEERIGSSTYLREFADLLKDNENIAMQLQSYITTANETRAGIRSTFLDGLSMATKSESVRNFLSHDELHINELKGDRPTLIYIIVPDETPIYDDLTGVLVSQLMNHYVRIAEQEYGGKLPIRMNVLLEELGNIGRAITNLPHLMSAGRSRNIRVEFVLQSIAQLDDIYGESNAVTIMDNCDVRIAFRVYHWKTLTELSQFCGETESRCEDRVMKEPLITQSQLAAMETGQALVIVSGRLKFITWLPDFTEMSISRMKAANRSKAKKRIGKEAAYFNVQKYVRERKGTKETDIDKMIGRIDRKIEELEGKGGRKNGKRSVKIISAGDEAKMKTAFRAYLDLNEEKACEAVELAKKGTLVIRNLDAKQAEQLVDLLKNCSGTKAVITEES